MQGMFIIDEIEFDGGKKIKDIIGGAGSFALIGARLWTSEPESQQLGMIVDKGSDFPQVILDELNDLHTGIVYRETPWRKTTYGYNRLRDNGFRLFEYLTPKKPIRAPDLLETGLIYAKTIHIITNPKTFVSVCEELAKYGNLKNRPKIVWEPTPESCLPENWHILQKALKYCDIFSPNEVDSANLLGIDISESKSRAKEFVSAFQEFQIGHDSQGWVVLRNGSDGCLIGACTSSTNATSDAVVPVREILHLPSVQMKNGSVLDTTGAGNAFCGAAILEYYRTGNIIEACAKATVAASFVIQQHGLPAHTKNSEGIDLWNGESVFQRLKEYYEFLASHEASAIKELTKRGV